MMELHTENSRDDSRYELAKNIREEINTAHERGVVSNSLEVDRQVVSDRHRQPKHHTRGDITRVCNANRQQMEWDHCLFALAVLPAQEDEGRCTGSNEETDHPRRRPWVFVSAVFEGQQEHDCRWGEEHESDQVQGFM